MAEPWDADVGILVPREKTTAPRVYVFWMPATVQLRVIAHRRASRRLKAT